MAAPTFGEDVSLKTEIDAALKTAPIICATDVSLSLRDRYDTAYGIYNHNTPQSDRPLALVGMHPSEDATTGSTLYERMALFEERQVFKRWGISLTEFFELPSDMCSYILEICAIRQTTEGGIVQNALRDLEANR